MIVRRRICLLFSDGAGAGASVELLGLLAPLDVDLEATHVLAVEVGLGVLCIALVVELNESEGALFSR